MQTSQLDDTSQPVTGSHRRTLDAIFRHPLAHNLEWPDVVGLFGKLGSLSEQSNGQLMLEIGAHRHVMRKPHTKDLTTDEVLEVRHFLTEAGASPTHAAPPPAHRDPAPPDLPSDLLADLPADLLVVIDHHGAKIFHIDISSAEPAEHTIKPYDPHHFLHHLTHKDQDRERGQRAPEEVAYYEQIAQAVADSGRIIVAGHGTGHSNAAHHFSAYLQTHHNETYQRVVDELTTDLSATTTPQLLELARTALAS